MTRPNRALGVPALLLLVLVACSGTPTAPPSASPNPSTSIETAPPTTSAQPTPLESAGGGPAGTEAPPPVGSPEPTATGLPTFTPAPTGTPEAPSPAGTTDAEGPTPTPASASTPVDPTTTPATPPTSPATADPSGGGGLSPELTAKLQKVLDKTATRYGVQGISAAVLLDDGSSWAGATGDRDVKTSTPVDPDTVFAIASITKTFVTATVMQLVAEGKLSLTDRLDRWVPSVPNASRITIAELLGHTSGVYNYFENPHYNVQVFGDPRHRWTFDEIMALVGAAYCKPGTCYHYSNTNFVLLGRIVELVTGHSLADEIATRLVTPLSLDNTGLQPDDPTPDDRAHAYLGGHDWTRKSPMLPTISAATVADAAGAMTSTASDLATWSHALYGGQVVPPAQLNEMMQFQKCHDNYGLGTRKLVVDGRVAYGHLGSLRGYMNVMLTFPREGATVVLLSNQGAWNLTAGLRKLIDALWVGIGAPAPQHPVTTNTSIHDGVTLRCSQGSPP